VVNSLLIKHSSNVQLALGSGLGLGSICGQFWSICGPFGSICGPSGSLLVC